MEMILYGALILLLAHLVLNVIFSLRMRKLNSFSDSFPWMGHLFNVYKSQFVGSYEGMRAHMVQATRQYGKNGICFLYLYHYCKTVVISSPQIIKQLGFHPDLKDKPTYAMQGMRVYLDGPFSRGVSDDSWKIRRKEYNHLLRKSSVENNFYDIFVKSANKLVELMFTYPSALDIHKAVVSVVQSVTIETLMGVKTSSAFDRSISYYTHSIGAPASLTIGNPLMSRIILSILRPIDEIFIKEMGNLRRKVFDKVYESMENNQCLSSDIKETYHPLPWYIMSRIGKNKKSEVITELHELLITASHTVSAAMCSTITFLAVLPELQERAWKEQHEIFGDDTTREPSLQDLRRMEFLERFIKESLRFSGSPFIAKQASADIEVDGITIPKDTIVVYLLDYMRKDPNYWKDPKVFDPDRFIEKNEKLKYSFALFGIGVRNCPGMNFAMTQIKITLSKVLRTTKLSPLNKDLKFEDLKFEAQILMEIKNPPLLQVEERSLALITN